MLLAAAVLIVFGVAVFGKWHFANAIASRAELREVADFAVVLAPDDPQTHFAAAAIYRKTFDQSDQDRSLMEYDTTTSLAQYNYLCWLELGNSRNRNGDLVGGEFALKRALDLAPNYAEVQWAYGNALLRSAKTDDGIRLIAAAAKANKRFATPAVVTMMELFNGNSGDVQERLGDLPSVNIALASYLANQNQFAGAINAWDMIPKDQNTAEVKDAGNSLIATFLAAKQFRAALRVFADLNNRQSLRTETGEIFDGGFEGGLKIKGASEFEWQITEGIEPQIAISQTQKLGGVNSLVIAFDSMQSASFRTISQLVAVDPGAEYEFEVFYRSDLKTTSTVRWSILNAVDGVEIMASEPIAASSDWAPLKTKFTMPATSEGIIVRLVRDRCQSTVCPINGLLWFDDISIQKL